MSSPLRVTMIGSLPPHRGISPYVRDLSHAVAERADVDLDVTSFRSLYPKWLYPGGDPSDANATPVDIPGARIRRNLHWWNPPGWVIEAFRMRGDIVHAQWWSVPLAPVYFVLLSMARLRGRRVVVTVHNVEPHEGGSLRRLVNRAVLPLAHHVIVHTDRNRVALVARGASQLRISVVPHGIARPAAATLEDRRIARRALNLPDAAHIILFLGNIRPYKGLNDLIDAFNLVHRRLPDAHLVIVGQPWGNGAAIRERIDDAGIGHAVTLALSYVSDGEMTRYFQACDLAAYPYVRFDAQSGAALEALRHGRAIVVTDVAGLSDLVGDARAVAPPRHPELLAAAILEVLCDSGLRERLEAGARARVSEMSWNRVAALTYDVYASLLSRRRERHRQPRMAERI